MALKEMSTVLDAEREALELENIPEYLSDSSLPSREAAVSMASKIFTEREQRTEQPEIAPHKSDEQLETLWPGVDHEFVPPARKSPSFYLCIGFMAGAAISIVGVLGYCSVSTLVAHKPSNDKHITVAADTFKPSSSSSTPAAAVHHDAGGGDVLVPMADQYQVQTGDTLAGIALRNYKRVSPRLLDEICKANNLRNANVLSLGQKLALPEYHSQATQVAGAGQVQ